MDYVEVNNLKLGKSESRVSSSESRFYFYEMRYTVTFIEC